MKRNTIWLKAYLLLVAAASIALFVTSEIGRRDDGPSQPSLKPRDEVVEVMSAESERAGQSLIDSRIEIPPDEVNP